MYILNWEYLRHFRAGSLFLSNTDTRYLDPRASKMGNERRAGLVPIEVGSQMEGRDSVERACPSPCRVLSGAVMMLTMSDPP